MLSFWKFLLGSKLLTATCHHWKGQWIWSTCQTWHIFFTKDNSEALCHKLSREQTSLCCQGFLWPLPISLQNLVKMPLFEGLFLSSYNTDAIVQHTVHSWLQLLCCNSLPLVRQWRSFMCSALSVALVWNSFLIPVKAATPSVVTFAQFFHNILFFIQDATSC